MRRAFKRVGAFLLAMVMCLSLFPVSALAFEYDSLLNGGVVAKPDVLKPKRAWYGGDVLLRLNRSDSQLTNKGMALIKYDYDHTEPAMPIIVGDVSSLMDGNDQMFDCTMTSTGHTYDKANTVFGRYGHSSIYIGQTVSGAMVSPDGPNGMYDELKANKYHPFRIQYNPGGTYSWVDRPVGVEVRIYKDAHDFQQPHYTIEQFSDGIHVSAANGQWKPADLTISYGFCADRNKFQLFNGGTGLDSVYLYNQTDTVEWKDSSTSRNPIVNAKGDPVGGFDNGIYYENVKDENGKVSKVARIITEHVDRSDTNGNGMIDMWDTAVFSNSKSPCLLGYDLLDTDMCTVNTDPSSVPDGVITRTVRKNPPAGNVIDNTEKSAVGIKQAGGSNLYYGRLYNQDWNRSYMNHDQNTNGFTIMLAPDEYAEVTYTYNVVSNHYVSTMYMNNFNNYGGDWNIGVANVWNANTGTQGLNIMVMTDANAVAGLRSKGQMSGDINASNLDSAVLASDYRDFFNKYVGTGKNTGCFEFSNAASYLWYSIEATTGLGYDPNARQELPDGYVPYYKETHQQTVIAPAFYNSDNASNLYASDLCMNHNAATQDSSFTSEVKNYVASQTDTEKVIRGGLVDGSMLQGIASNMLYFNNSGLDDEYIGGDSASAMNSGYAWYMAPYITLGVCNNLSVLRYHRDGGVIVTKEAPDDMQWKQALFLVTFSTKKLDELATKNKAWNWFYKRTQGNVLAGAGFGYNSGRFLRVGDFVDAATFKNAKELKLLFTMIPGQAVRLIAPPGVEYSVQEIKSYSKEADTKKDIYELYYDEGTGEFRARHPESFTSEFELTSVSANTDGYNEPCLYEPSSVGEGTSGTATSTRPTPAQVAAGSLPAGCTGYTTNDGVVGYSGRFTDLFTQDSTLIAEQWIKFGDSRTKSTPNIFKFNNGLDSRQIEIKKTVVDENGAPTTSDKTFTVSVELGANGTAKPTSLTWKASGGADSDKSGASGNISVTAYKGGSALPDGSPLADADKITVTLKANDSVFLTFKGAFGSYCAITEENPGCSVTFKPSGEAFYTAPGSAAVNGDLAGPTSDTAPTVYFDNGAIGSSKLEVVNSDKPVDGITVSKQVMTGSWWPKEGGTYKDTAPGHVQFTYEGAERPTKVIFKDGEGNELSAADVAYIADANGKKTGAASDSSLVAAGTKSFCLKVDPKKSINVQFESDAPVKCSLREIPQTDEPSGGLAVDISNGTVFHPDEAMAQTGESSLENGLDMTPSQKYYCEIGGGATGGRITYTNSAEEIKGKASVIIDYNLNGLAASKVEDMGLSDLLVSGKGSNVVPVDGVYDLNDTVSMDLINKSLTNNGQPLKAGDVVKIQFSGKNTSGESVPLTLECKLDGVFADAKGTQKIDGAGYKITKPGTHVLYAHWTFTMTVDKSGGGGGGGTVTSPSAQLKQIIWHDYWQGTTTTLYSYTTAQTALGNGAIIDVGTNSGLLPGPIGRPGWWWYGWGDNASITSTSIGSDHMFKWLWGQANGEYYKQLKAFVDAHFAYSGYATLDLFSYWTPAPYSFNGNGGYFGKIDPKDFDDGTWQSKNTVKAGQKDSQGNIYRIWKHADSEGKATVDWIAYMDFVVLPRVQPYRIGYAFDGWFYDAAATIPLQEFETGLQPGRWYFAGWAAEDVTVTYHDTREGHGTTYTKTYKYGEALELLRGITDTSGQHFAGWSTSPDSTDTLADGGYLMKSDPKMSGCWNLDTGRIDDLGTTSAVNRLNDAFGGALTRHDADHSGTDSGGSDGGFYEPDADGGVTGTSHYWTLDLYSVWDPVTINYKATLNFNDALNNDRARPTKMTLGLVSSVTNQLVETKTVDVELTASQQVVTFDNGGEGFPTTTADASVEKAAYRVYIKDYTDRNGKVHVIQDTTAQSGTMEMPTMSDGATTPVTSYAYALDNINQIDPGDAQLYTGQIYLNHNLVSTGTDVKFTLNFDDDSDNDGKRPSAVTLTLYADGVPVQDWHDMGDGEMRNAAVVSVNSGMCEVSADGNAWTYTFEDYQKYKDGKEIEYTVKVSDYNEDEYSIIYLKPSGGGSAYGCTLVHRNETRSVPVLIEWQDDYDRDQYRPESVDIQLTAYQYNRVTGEWESVQVKTATVKGDARAQYWEYTFYGMKNNNDGEEIMYIADVISDPNALVPETSEKYTWTTQGAKNDETAKIVISKLGNTKSVPIRVSWADGNNNDGLRPSSIVLKLYADGKLVEGEDYSVVLSGGMTDDEWTYTFENLPVYREGESGVEIVYTISAEEAKPGDLYGEYEERGVLGEPHKFTKYMAEYPTKGGTFSPELAESSEAMVRLTHEINQIEVPVKITWMDSNNRDAMRPSYVTLALTAYQWNDETYKWEYVETATQTVKADGANTMTADEWTASFGLHDMYHDGVKIIYHLAVVSDLNEYLPEGSFEYGWVETAHGNQVDAVPEVTVSQNVNITSVTSTVFWDDSNNQDNIRPKNIILQLYAHAPGQTPEAVSGEAYRVNLSGDPTADNWTYTFSGMPKYAAGQSGVELIYTVRAIEAEGEPLYGYYIITANGGEEEVLRYEASYLHEDREAGTTENTLDADLSDRAYVKLSHVCETKTMNFSVNWHDDDDRDAMRMSSVSVDLYKTVGSGEPKYLRTLVITAGDNGTWTYKVTGLPGYEGGQPVKYTIEIPEDVREQLAAGGYTATTEDNIVHLYHTPETGEIRTQLYWSDEDDNDGYRPDSVVAALYANGTPTGRTADLNEENNWSAAWTGLNVHYNQGAEHGLDVVYSVVIEAPDGYTVAYNPADTTVEKNETLQIQLSHVKDTAEVPVNVFWNDTSNTDGKRPQNITVQLIADGRPTNNTLTLDAGNAGESENVWAGKFENMPVYGGDGEEIYYSLKVYDETTSTGGYSVMTAGTTLYLSYKPVKSSMYVSFQFSDGNNTDGRRPTGLYLQLKANGVPVDDSEYKHTVSFDTNVDGYFQNFGELPVYAADNTKIRYNVEVSFAPELGATDYDVWTSKDVKLSESSNAATNQIIVKLTRAVDETELTGHVYWFDCNDVEGNRPDALNIVVTDAYSGANVTYRLDAGKGTVTKAQGGEVVGSVDGPE